MEGVNYIVRTFVNVTMYSLYKNNTVIKNDLKSYFSQGSYLRLIPF
jgi:hypothetical protein